MLFGETSAACAHSADNGDVYDVFVGWGIVVVIAEKEELPLLKEVVKEEEKPTKQLNKKSYESDTINEDEYEIIPFLQKQNE